MDKSTARLAAGALRTTAGTLDATLGFLESPHAWIGRALSATLRGSADLLQAGETWKELRKPLTEVLESAMEHLPQVQAHEARSIAKGIVATGDVVRKWILSGEDD